MRLLETSSLNLHEFFGDSIPPYAILSHRWEGAEVIFQDLEAGITSQKESSFAKISGYCRQAAVYGWKLAWADSCCIDNISSSELSEAIKSIFQWYRGAEVCYVYLCDVSSGLDWLQHSQIGSRFRLSEWWTRGRTLQELLAPDDLIFYDCECREIGTKRSSEFVISDITGISRIHLHGYRDASVAQKMSWAANRETARPEDRAYSLLGLFNVNMPPLYGEGPKAFRRLQLEILRDSDDESLFAWQTDNGYRGELFAPSPAAFAIFGKIARRIFTRRPAYSMTNKGLQIELTLVRPVDKSRQAGVVWTPLNCGWEDYDGAVGLVLIEGDIGMGETPTFKWN
jgi:hypothetical protein